MAGDWRKTGRLQDMTRLIEQSFTEKHGFSQEWCFENPCQYGRLKSISATFCDYVGLVAQW
jgi:hypothetical protein